MQRAIEAAFPCLRVIARHGDSSKFEISIDPTNSGQEFTIFSGKETYKQTGNLRDKYPLGGAAVEMVKTFLAGFSAKTMEVKTSKG